MIYVTHDQTEAMTMADRIVVLRAGRIEQAGSPLELYNTPANRFVAGFIGSPRMNFLSGTSLARHRRCDGASVAIGGTAGEIAVARDTDGAAAGEDGDTRLAARASRLRRCWRTVSAGTVELVEHMGGEMLMVATTLRQAGDRLMMSAARRRAWPARRRHGAGRGDRQRRASCSAARERRAGVLASGPGAEVQLAR